MCCVKRSKARDEAKHKSTSVNVDGAKEKDEYLAKHVEMDETSKEAYLKKSSFT